MVARRPRSGVKLEEYYVYQYCAPTRGAFHTGRVRRGRCRHTALRAIRCHSYGSFRAETREVPRGAIAIVRAPPSRRPLPIPPRRGAEEPHPVVDARRDRPAVCSTALTVALPSQNTASRSFSCRPSLALRASEWRFGAIKFIGVVIITRTSHSDA